MKRRTILWMAILILVVYTTGCHKQPTKDKENLTIVTSFYPIYLHVINIAKDIPGVEVVNMTEPQMGCLHDYQLSPNDIKTLDRADIFVINGGGMESFMDKAISQFPHMPIIDASSGIDLLEDKEHGELNPHVWVSVSGAIEQVKQIMEELIGLDQVNSDQYIENGNEYIGRLEELSKQMHEVLDPIPNKNIVTFHEAFPYFAKEFSFNIVGTILSDSDTEPSAKELAQVIEAIKKENVKAVFMEPQYRSKSAQLIGAETGVEIYTLDPIVTGEASGDVADDYINKMKENLKTLEEALE